MPMRTLQEHIDDLDRMVDSGTSVAKIRSQIAFIGREVAALQADYAGLAQAHAEFKQAAQKQIANAKAKNLQAAQKVRALQAQLEGKRAEDSVDKKARPVIEALLHEDGGLTIDEIAERTGYITSMAHHYCEELEVIGFVERVRFHGDKRRIDGPDWGYDLSKKGRKWVAKELA